MTELNRTRGKCPNCGAPLRLGSLLRKGAFPTYWYQCEACNQCSVVSERMNGLSALWFFGMWLAVWAAVELYFEVGLFASGAGVGAMIAWLLVAGPIVFRYETLEPFDIPGVGGSFRATDDGPRQTSQRACPNCGGYYSIWDLVKKGTFPSYVYRCKDCNRWSRMSSGRPWLAIAWFLFFWAIVAGGLIAAKNDSVWAARLAILAAYSWLVIVGPIIFYFGPVDLVPESHGSTSRRSDSDWV